jgi:hypothetical protein
MVIGEILNMGLYQWCSGLLFPANNIERKVCVKEINNIKINNKKKNIINKVIKE